MLQITFNSHTGFSFHKQALQKSLCWAATYKFKPFVLFIEDWVNDGLQ